MDNICAKIPEMHMHAGEKPVKCVISGNEMDNSDFNLFSALSSSLEEVSDEEENFPESRKSFVENVSLDINQERKALEAWARRPE